MSSRRDYDYEAEQIINRRARCPVACRLWDQLFEAMGKTLLDPAEQAKSDVNARRHPFERELLRRHRLEVALVGLGASIDNGREIGRYEVEFYEALLKEHAA